MSGLCGERSGFFSMGGSRGRAAHSDPKGLKAEAVLPGRTLQGQDPRGFPAVRRPPRNAENKEPRWLPLVPPAHPVQREWPGNANKPDCASEWNTSGVPFGVPPLPAARVM